MPRTFAKNGTRGVRTRVVAVLLSLAVPSILLAPLVASGEPKPKPAKRSNRDASAAEQHDPENVTAISRYMETVVKGNELFVAKDSTGAIDSYKKAVQLSPRQPLAHLLLAEAYLAGGNLGEAEAAAQQAYEAESKNALLRAHVLFLRADIYERQKKWEEAKVAWQAYVEQTAKVGPDAGAHPQSGAERLKAIQKIVELEKAYVAVRERIAAEKADGGKGEAKK